MYKCRYCRLDLAVTTAVEGTLKITGSEAKIFHQFQTLLTLIFSHFNFLVYLVTLFNNTCYVEPNRTMNLNYEKWRMWKEPSVPYFKILLHYKEGVRKNHKTVSITGLWAENWTSDFPIQYRNVNVLTVNPVHQYNSQQSRLKWIYQFSITRIKSTWPRFKPDTSWIQVTGLPLHKPALV
jgi:hypothetical protein